MKDAVLLELASRWQAEAIAPITEDGSEEAKIGNAIRRGNRETKRECADTLVTLIEIIGEKTIN